MPDLTPSRTELRLPVATDSTAEFAEAWMTTRPAHTGEYQGIHYAHDGEYLLCTCRVVASPRYANIIERAYSSVLEVLNDQLYRDFCIGRSRAFQRYSLPAGKLCAATCLTALGNIRCLIEPDNTARYGLAHGYGLADLDQIKIYVRHAEHIPLVRSICCKVFSPDAEVAYLNLDMCRSGLLVEIEGVAR